MFSMLFSLMPLTISNSFYADVYQQSYGSRMRTITSQGSKQQTVLNSERRQNIQNGEIQAAEIQNKDCPPFLNSLSYKKKPQNQTTNNQTKKQTNPKPCIMQTHQFILKPIHSFICCMAVGAHGSAAQHTLLLF